MHRYVAAEHLLVGYMDRMDYVSMLSNETAYVECVEHVLGSSAHAVLVVCGSASYALVCTEPASSQHSASATCTYEEHQRLYLLVV
jgi:hypothetical protein